MQICNYFFQICFLPILFVGVARRSYSLRRESIIIRSSRLSVRASCARTRNRPRQQQRHRIVVSLSHFTVNRKIPSGMWRLKDRELLTFLLLVQGTGCTAVQGTGYRVQGAQGTRPRRASKDFLIFGVQRTRDTQRREAVSQSLL